MWNIIVTTSEESGAFEVFKFFSKVIQSWFGGIQPSIRLAKYNVENWKDLRLKLIVYINLIIFLYFILRAITSLNIVIKKYYQNIINIISNKK